VEYTTISQVALEIEGVDEEPTKQSMLPAMNNDAKVDNDINDDNLDRDHNDAEIDDNVDDNNLDANHNNDAPLCFCSINDILEMTWFGSCALVAEELHVVSFDEPASFIDDERSPSWRKTMMEEIMSTRRMTPRASSISHLVTSQSGQSGCSR
jgi:hypothetical protein